MSDICFLCKTKTPEQVIRGTDQARIVCDLVYG